MNSTGQTVVGFLTINSDDIPEVLNFLCDKLALRRLELQVDLSQLVDHFG